MTFSLIIQLIRKISKECFQTCKERVHIATFQLTNKFTDIKTIVFIADGCVKRSYEIKKTIFYLIIGKSQSIKMETLIIILYRQITALINQWDRIIFGYPIFRESRLFHLHTID